MNFIEDNLKKESKRVLLTFILCYAAALIFPLLYYIDYDMDDILFFSILFFVMGCYSLFGLKYQVSISQETMKHILTNGIMEVQFYTLLNLL